MKSPSGSSGPLPRGGVQEQQPAQGNTQATQASTAAKSRLGKGPRGGSDYTSSDDDDPPLPQSKLAHTGNALSMAALAGKTFDQIGRAGAAAAPAAAPERGRTIMREDEAEEVSSEEIEEIDSSR